MIDLVYPFEGVAPLITGGCGAVNAQAAIGDGLSEESKNEVDVEMFPVVTEEGVVVGRATREFCHGGSKLLHPVVHLHLIDRQERIYLQKRSMKKDIQPGKWDTAVGGHVMYGESIVEALHRESGEELGLTDYNPVYLGSYVYDTGRDMEFVNIFAAVGHFCVHPDHDEVDEGKWMSTAQIERMAARKQLTPNFQSEFEQIKGKLLALL